MRLAIVGAYCLRGKDNDERNFVEIGLLLGPEKSSGVMPALQSEWRWQGICVVR